MCARYEMINKAFGRDIFVSLERALKLLVGSHESITIAMANEQLQLATRSPNTTTYILGVRLKFT